jgi:hypothetical protein
VTKLATTVLAVALASVFAGCSTGPQAPTTSAPKPNSTIAPNAYGGCGATQVTDGASPPPAWALGGFGGWPGIRWAASSPSSAVAILFAEQLVAKGARPDGSSNKVLWVTETPTNQLTIVARPLDAASPTVTLNYPPTAGNQTPSLVDLPSPGCWSFQLHWGTVHPSTASLDLWVLPAGTTPSRAVSG